MVIYFSKAFTSIERAGQEKKYKKNENLKKEIRLGGLGS